MPDRPENVYAQLMPQVLDYLAIPPDRPAGAGRPAMTTARLDRSPQRGACAPDDPPRRPARPPPAAGSSGPAPRPRPRSPAPSVDSRRVTPGSIFVALRGERADGHAFVADALRAGAAAALVERPVDLPADLPMRPRSSCRTRFAPSRTSPPGGGRATRCAWSASPARRARRSPRRSPPTSCRATLVTLRNEGNLNSETGLPMTLLRLEPRTRRRSSR